MYASNGKRTRIPGLELAERAWIQTDRSEARRQRLLRQTARILRQRILEGERSRGFTVRTEDTLTRERTDPADRPPSSENQTVLSQGKATVPRIRRDESIGSIRSARWERRQARWNRRMALLDQRLRLKAEKRGPDKPIEMQTKY